MAEIIPSSATSIEQATIKKWTKEEGESLEKEYKGTQADLDNLYEQLKNSGSNTIASLNRRQQAGRHTLVVGYVGDSQILSGGQGSGQNTPVEELHTIDILKDIAAAPAYESLSSNDIMTIKQMIQRGDHSGTLSGDSLELFRRYAHGEDTYLETGYIYRRTFVTNSTLVISDLLATVGTVITDEDTLKDVMGGRMKSIIDTLPSGEWLVRPIEIRYQGRGKYYLSTEYQWAEKWSDLYGGSLTYT